MANIIHRYGWIPQRNDPRDRVFRISRELIEDLPPSVDLRPSGFMPPVYNQLNLGSCVANGVGACHQYEQAKQKLTDIFMPSRLFIYYNARKMAGSVHSDRGCQIRDGIKSVVKQGVCPEQEWPYEVNQFACQPPRECYIHAAKHQVMQYLAVAQNLQIIKGVLASGYPIVGGFQVYDSFESKAVKKTGIVPMPSEGESQVGGHAVVIVGYNDQNQFIVRNSWGEDWGDNGYCYMPMAYWTDKSLSSDLWAIQFVEQGCTTPA